MTPPTGDSDRLASLLSTLLGKVEPAPPIPDGVDHDFDPLVHMVIYSFMLWESAPGPAAEALASLYKSIVDLNELRVALPKEIVAWIGMRDDAAAERADRLRAVLNGVYQREHSVSLTSVSAMSKREARAYLDTLEGMPPFVSARTTLYGLHGHAIPVDRWLRERLIAEGVIDETVSMDEAERWLERQIRASDAEQIVPVLEGWRAVAPKPKTRSKRSTRKSGSSKRVKKES